MTKQNASNETPPKWITPVLTSGWADYGNGYQGVRYRKWASDYVEIIGEIKPPTGAVSGTVIFTLPANCVPSMARVFRQVCDNGTSFAVAMLDVEVSGQVYLFWSISNPAKFSVEAAYFAGQ